MELLEAAKVYNEAAVELFGEDIAYLNPIEGCKFWQKRKDQRNA